jgi:hypothetical protein
LRYFALVMCVLFLGCAGGGDEKSEAFVGGNTTGLEFGLAVEPEVVKPGTTISMVLTVVNPREVPHSVQFSSGCMYGFGLWNAAGELVAPPPPMCTMNAPVVEFGAGEVVERRFEWVWDEGDVAPGTYFLKAGIGPRGEFESSAGVEVHLGAK